MTTEAVFQVAFGTVWNHEGDFQCERDDPGNWTGGVVGRGELKGTKRGISAAAYPQEDIKNLSDQAIKMLYWSDYWMRHHISQLPGAVIPVKVFDCGVNIGMSSAVACLQRALRSCGRKVSEDGLIGQETVDGVRAVTLDPLLTALKSELAGHYRLVAQKQGPGAPLAGWLNRAYS